MKGNKIMVLAGALVALLVLVGIGPAAAQSITAQSAQVHFAGVEQAYQIVGGTETWSYNWEARNPALAAFDTYFTLTQTGSPGTNDINNIKHDAFKDNKCKFWAGDPLVSVTRSKKTGSGQYNLVATPKSPGQYAPKHGWTVVTEEGEGSVNLTVSEIFVASESFLKKVKPAKDWTTKYSFTMTDSLGNSRLTALTIELLYDDGMGGGPIPIDTRTLDVGFGGNFTQTLEYGQDWLYEGNAGKFGNLTAQTFLLDGMVNVILGVDTFPNNDGEGGTRALIPDQSYQISEEGTYTLRFSGAVKGNDFTSDQSFEVEVTLVTIGGC